MLKTNLNEFSGVKALVATSIGALIGCSIAYFLSILVANSPTGVDPASVRLLYIMVILSGSIAGFGIEVTRQLQKGSSEQAYYHKGKKSHDR